ncbi:hypothetical protein Q1695_012107 [Nippostrongylus brasiliensis]|nr:hypothetical protein Q1695_012107 [Nippostrongylus brasiliensis]
MEHGAQESTSSTSQFYSGRTPAEHREEVAGRETRNMEGLSFDDEQVEKFFNVSETVQWIKDNRYTRVALQLPDHFLRNAARLARIIESETGAKVFILADTSYRR